MREKKRTILYTLSFVLSILVGLFVLDFFLPRYSPTYTYSLENAYPNLKFNAPVGIYYPNDGSDNLYVVEQEGKIQVFKNSNITSQKFEFLDISDRVISGGERGLLGLAFHPNFSLNGKFYVDYTKDPSGNTVISEFKVNSTDPTIANVSSERILLEVNQPYSNHNGGQIAFGSDGYLYIGLGDGGSANDPLGNGQNRSSLLGSILRIDINNGDPYSIPNDNPFKNNTQGFKEEIYAYGLRNPWRFSFDNKTSSLWVADVGQNAWEEIDLVEKGKNYGWAIMEGKHCLEIPPCNQTGLIEPIFEYSHSLGRSITGGFVYGGPTLMELEGYYIYGDFQYGTIWALKYEDGNVIENRLLIDSDILIPSFGIDNNNELLICSYSGTIYKLNSNIIS